MPSCLIIQMPRCGNKYKMFSHIIPSTQLDVTDLLYSCEHFYWWVYGIKCLKCLLITDFYSPSAPRDCFICGCLAEFECLQCLPDSKLQPGRIKQFCSTCNTQVGILNHFRSGLIHEIILQCIIYIYIFLLGAHQSIPAQPLTQCTRSPSRCSCW